MFLRYGVLADSVVPGDGGKWNVIGTMNVIQARSWPATHRRLGILLRIEGDYSEIGEHTLQVHFVNALGERISGPPELKISLEPPTTPGFPLGGEVGVEINNLVIPAAGNYDFAIRIDGRYVDSIPLYAREPS